MKIHSLIPILAVRDVRKTSAFYEDVLGFEPDSHIAMEGTPRYGYSQRGDTIIMFHYREGIEERSERDGYRAFDTVLYFHIDDLEATHEELQAKGYEVSDLEVTPYHMKEFEIRDPDGYRLTLGQETDEPSTETAGDS